MNTELLKRLCSASGVCGYEAPVAKILAEEIQSLVDEWYIDPIGNLVAHKKGNGKKLMAAAHMDQIGMIVTAIEKTGEIRFAKMGGLNHLNLLSDRVIFANGTIGTVGCELLNYPTEFDFDKLFIDIGSTNRDETEKVVAVGDVCTFCAECIIDSTKVISPALDNRIGCVIAIEALRRAKSIAHDLYVVFTVQEEVGLRGAGAAANAIDPDYALNLDTARTYYTSDGKQPQIRLGGGAAIDIKNGAVICSEKMVDFLTGCAEKAAIPYQYAVGSAGGIDVARIQQTGRGVAVGAISVATRNLHSMSEVELLSDIEACIQLATVAFESKIG